MNLHQKNLTLVFLFTLLLTLFIPALFPGLQMLFFAPFLAILYYQKSFMQSLWGSVLCGLILDLFSSHAHFGLYPLNFCITTALLYGQRKHFFSDSGSTLPLMTYFFSVISTAIQALLLSIFEKNLTYSLSWIFSDLLIMPAADAAFAFICFIVPSLLFGRRIRRGNEYFT